MVTAGENSMRHNHKAAYVLSYLARVQCSAAVTMTNAHACHHACMLQHAGLSSSSSCPRDSSDMTSQACSTAVPAAAAAGVLGPGNRRAERPYRQPRQCFGRHAAVLQEQGLLSALGLERHHPW